MNGPSSDPPICISSNLSRLRKQNGSISLKNLSERTGVPYGTLYSWESSNVQPKNWNQAKSVANFFKVSVDELVFGKTEHPQSHLPQPPKDLETFQLSIKGTLEVKIKGTRNELPGLRDNLKI